MNLTASNISMTGLSNYYQTGVHREDIESVKLIVGDSIDDFCLFYNLSRLHSEVFWLPDAYLKSAHRIVGTDDRFGENESLASHIVNTVNQKIGYGQNDKNVALISASLTGRQLIYRKRWLGEICLIDAHSFVTKVIPTSGQNIALDCVSITMETNNYRNQQDMIFQNNVGVSRLQTPRPKNFTHINPMEHRWMTTFTVEGFTPPPIPGLISKIVSGGHITTHEARITRDGMAYFCPNVIVMNGDDIDTNLIYPRLRLLTDDEMIDDFFVYSGYKTSVSDKGSYFRDSLARFGSLDKLAAFFGKKVHRDLFDKFLLSKQAAQASEDEIVNLENEKQNNNYLSFEVVASTLGDEQNAIRLLDELIESNVIKRGLIFQCELCRRACWYDIAEVQNTFNCKRCEHTQAYSYSHWKSPSQPAWYFKLVEPVYLFYSSNSYLTALALAKIKEKSRLDFHFAGETEIIDSRGRKKELDIVVVSDGKVIIGECKNCTPSSDDISKYIRLYPKLIIKPDHFLLATTSSSVTDEVKKAVASISPSTIYTKADLL